MLNLCSFIGYASSNDLFEKAERQSKIIFTIVGIIFAVMVVGSIALTIYFVNRGHKATKHIVDKVKQKIAENIEYEKTKNVCEYCGGHLEDEDKRCSNCGAQRKKK
jgi:hypothetical protein